MPAPDHRPAAPERSSPGRSGLGVLGAAAVALGLVCAVCLALLLVLSGLGVDPWDGLTVIPWFGLPAAFLLFGAALVRSVLRRRRA